MIQIAFDQEEFDEMDRINDILQKYFKPGSTVIFNDVEIADVKGIDFDTCSHTEVDGKTGERKPVTEVIIECNSGKMVTGMVWGDYDLRMRFFDDVMILSTMKKEAA